MILRGLSFRGSLRRLRQLTVLSNSERQFSKCNLLVSESKIGNFWYTMAARHTSTSLVEGRGMSVKVLPALKDNYMYLIVDKSSQDAAIVDPVNPYGVMEAVSMAKVNLTTVLTTHHHFDHAGGNKELSSLKPGLTICGNDDRIDAQNRKVSNGDCFSLGSLTVSCYETPCHTTGHICYFVTSNEEDRAVFTGDTLFISGCGRFFEGSPHQMYHALCEVLATLPKDTKVFCGHEYTVNNLLFAQHVEPESKPIQDKLTWSKKQREQNLPTIPSSIAEELSYNPFMRVNEPSVQKHAQCSDPVETMKFIRQEKDNFKAKV